MGKLRLLYRDNKILNVLGLNLIEQEEKAGEVKSESLSSGDDANYIIYEDDSEEDEEKKEV